MESRQGIWSAITLAFSSEPEAVAAKDLFRDSLDEIERCEEELHCLQDILVDLGSSGAAESCVSVRFTHLQDRLRCSAALPFENARLQQVAEFVQRGGRRPVVECVHAESLPTDSVVSTLPLLTFETVALEPLPVRRVLNAERDFILAAVEETRERITKSLSWAHFVDPSFEELRQLERWLDDVEQANNHQSRLKSLPSASARFLPQL